MSKAIIWIVVIVVVGLGAWWFWGMHSSIQAPSQTAQTYGTQPGAPAQSNGTQQGASVSDNSDAALSQDLSAVDNQMNGLNSDSATADQSLNDKPIPQQ